ncbi:MAG: hypothetical protein S4CHLAM37_10610 [Chlamydiia bacterium]|nr:hypothetical protein [Chlamydiia bacterium]
MTSISNAMQTPDSCFTLGFDDLPDEINPHVLSTNEKISDIAHRILFFVPKYLFGSIIRNSIHFSLNYSERHIIHTEKEYDRIWKDKEINIDQYSQMNFWSHVFRTKESIERLRSNYEVEEVAITTPDGIKLDGAVYMHNHNKALDSTPTLVFFGGTGELHKSGFGCWIFDLLQKCDTPINLVLFDYRGCGRSEGTPSSVNDIAIDAETVYQFVHKKLETKEDDIHLAGFSLGASIATKLKSHHLDSKGFLISNRSFSSMSEEAKHFVADKLGRYFYTGVGRWLSNITGEALGWLACQFGWDFNTLKDFDKIKSPKLVINHESDPIIPYPASLYHKLESEERLHECDHIKLKNKHYNEHFLLHHTEDLKHYTDQDGEEATEHILKFIQGSIKA